MNRRAPSLVAVVALALVAAACSGGSDKASTTTRSSGTTSSTSTSTSLAPTTTSTTTASTPPPTGPCGADNEPDKSLQISPTTSATSLLTSVTVRATARCTDEVVFAFGAGAPVPVPVTISIVQPPFTLAGTGKAVTVAGQRFYKVQFEQASTYDFTKGGPSYTGPTNIVPNGTSHVRQVVNTVAFEGVVTWIIGVGPDDEFVFGGSATPPSLTLTF